MECAGGSFLIFIAELGEVGISRDGRVHTRDLNVLLGGGRERAKADAGWLPCVWVMSLFFFNRVSMDVSEHSSFSVLKTQTVMEVRVKDGMPLFPRPSD